MTPPKSGTWFPCTRTTPSCSLPHVCSFRTRQPQPHEVRRQQAHPKITAGAIWRAGTSRPGRDLHSEQCGHSGTLPPGPSAQSRHRAQCGAGGGSVALPALPVPPPKGLHLLLLACCYLCQPTTGLWEDAAAEAVNSFQSNAKQVKFAVSRGLPAVLICTGNQS